MKQIEYTEKQKEIIELLEPFKILIRSNTYNVDIKELKRIIEDIEEKYDIKHPYLTLRQYIKENGCGAYHDFYFTIYNREIKVSTISEFEKIYNKELLDQFYVIKDDSKSFGGNCDNYQCDHYLTIDKVEDEK